MLPFFIFIFILIKKTNNVPLNLVSFFTNHYSSSFWNVEYYHIMEYEKIIQIRNNVFLTNTYYLMYIQSFPRYIHYILYNVSFHHFYIRILILNLTLEVHIHSFHHKKYVRKINQSSTM